MIREPHFEEDGERLKGRGTERTGGEHGLGAIPMPHTAAWTYFFSV